MKYFVTWIVLMILTATILHGQVILQNQNHFGGSEWDGVADYFHRGNYTYIVSHTYSSDFDVEENAQPVTYFVFELDSALNLNSKLELVPSVGWSKDLVWVPFGNTCNDDACYFIIQDYALPTSFYLFRYDIPLNGNVSYIQLNDSWDNQIGRMQFLQVKDEFIEVWGRAFDASTRIFRYDISDLSLLDSFTLTNTEFNYKTSWDYSVVSNGDTSITLRSNWGQNPNPKNYELKYEMFLGKKSIENKDLEPGRSISLVGFRQFRDDYYVWGYVHHLDSTGTDYYNADAIILKFDGNFNKISELVLSGSEFESISDIEIDDSRIVFCGTSHSNDGDFYENNPSNKDFFIGISDTALKFIEMDYIGGADLEIGGKLDMSKSLSVCFQSDNLDSSEIVPVTYGDRDIYVSTVSFSKDCIDSYYIYDTSYVCYGDTVMFSGNYIHLDTMLVAFALGVYCDTLIETEFIILDSIMVFIDSLYHSTGTDGYIGIHPSGGLSPYQYQWSNGVSDSNYIDNLSPGIYIVTITDSNNCSKVMDIACDIATGLSNEYSPNRMHCRFEGRSIVVDDGVNYLYSNLNIYTSAGIPIATYRLDAKSTSINIESYPSGIYFAEYVNFEGVRGYCKVYIP